MTESVLYLTLAYAVLGAVVLGLNIHSRWPLWVKLATIAGVTAMYFVTWQAFQGLLGWPAGSPVPERFILLASSVTEPDKTTGDAGVIHLWVTPVIDDQPAPTPRAFALPYSAPLHREVREAEKAMRNGILQVGRTRPADPGAQAPTDTRRFARDAQKITITDLADPALPEK